MRTELPTLYARSSSGAILEWDIEIEDDRYRTTTGQQGSLNKVVSKWTVAKPKNVGQANATTAEDQAYNEAVAKWKKKMKREGYWENVKDIDNTPRFIEPMLAQKLRDHPDKAIMPCMVDKKYNGGRCVIVADGAFTRKGETYVAIPHIIEAVAPLFDKSPDLLLDGEGYNHDLRFKLNELMSILRTTKGKKLTEDFFRRSEQIVRLYVYDGYGFDCPCKVSVKLPTGQTLTLDEGEAVTADTPNILRREALKHLIKGIPYLVWVPYSIAPTLDEVYRIYGEHVADGMEGSIIRNFNAPYEHKRSYNLLKVKPTDDSEGVIVSINEGTGNTSGLAATATLKWKGMEFEATFMGSIETRQQILREADKWVGQEVTFLYNGLTGKGTPNYARIDPDNCFQGKK